MKKIIYIWLVSIAFLLNGCVDDPFELPPPVEQESIFGGDISIDGIDIDISVSQDGYELITGYEIDEDGLYLLKGALVPANCSNCGPSLEIIIRDEEIGPAPTGDINADDIQDSYRLGYPTADGEATLTLSNYNLFDYVEWGVFLADSLLFSQEPAITIEQIPGSFLFIDGGVEDNCHFTTSFSIENQVRHLSIEIEENDTVYIINAIGQDPSEEVFWFVNEESLGSSDYITIPKNDSILDLLVCLSNVDFLNCEPIGGPELMSSTFFFSRNPGSSFDFCIPDISIEYENLIQSYARIVYTSDDGTVYNSDFLSFIDNFELVLTDLEDYSDPDGAQVIKFNTSFDLPLFSQFEDVVNIKVDSLTFALGHP